MAYRFLEVLRHCVLNCRGGSQSIKNHPVFAKVEQKVEQNNFSMKITIRTRKRDEATSFIYLDIRDGQKSRKQAVKGFVYSAKKLTKDQKEHNAEMMKRAEDTKNDVLMLESPVDSKKITLSRLTKLYCDNKGVSENTVKSFKQMLDCVDGSITADSVTTDVINDQYKKINSCQLSNNSKLLYRSKLDAVIRYGIKKSYIRVGVLEKVDDKIKSKTHTREFLTKDEVSLMIAEYSETKKNWMRIFLFSCFTGLRHSDIKNLRWSNIQNDVIRLQTQKTDTAVTVPLNDNAKSLLPVKSGNDSFVFSVPDTANIRKDLLLWAGKKGIKKSISFHTARHTFATLSVQGGVDLYAVSKLLGHKNIKTTQIYADMVSSMLKESVDKLNNIFL